MGTGTKTFDCVALKEAVQAKILADYEARKSEFDSFRDYLRSTESDWEQSLRQRFAKDSHATSDS